MTSTTNSPPIAGAGSRSRVVIVGGVAGGMSTATRLRRNDESREIVVLERGEYVSFANCGLPYYLGGVIEEREELLLQTPEALAERFAIDVRVRHEVVAIDKQRRVVTVRRLAEPGLPLEELEYDDLVLATGAAPVRPPIPGIDLAHTLRDVPDADRINALLAEGVATAVVLGGGFIGLEMAENLVARGVEVAVVELADQLLAPLDPEMAQPVAVHLAERGVAVRTGVSATAIEVGKVTLSDGSVLPAELVIAAIGVRPESTLAAEAGLEVSDRGGIVVDRHQRTSDAHIYAVGDAAQKLDAMSGDGALVPLAQSANRHGRLVADVIAGRITSAQPVLGTAVVGVFGLTVAATGWNEKRARAADRAIRVIHTHPASHAGYYPGAESMALKLVVDAATDAILGAQAVGGEGVDKRIDIIATAIRGGLSASDLADLELAYAPQFGSAKDPINMLGFVADNLLAETTDTIQWHELADAMADGAVLVDVRTPGEFAQGAIPGALNLPLDELRERHTELPAGPVVVHCRVGQRGHVAARLLRQLGHQVSNLDGGWLTWKAGTAAQKLR